MKYSLPYTLNSGVDKRTYQKWTKTKYARQLAFFTSLDEYRFHRDTVGYFQKHFFEKMEEIQTRINEKIPVLQNDPVLTLLVSDMLFVNQNVEELKHSMGDTHPNLTRDSRKLLDALRAVDFNPYNIDSITFKIKKANRLQMEDVFQKKLSDVRKMDSRQETCTITGLLPILEIVKTIRDKQQEFENLAINEARYSDKRYLTFQRQAAQGYVKSLYVPRIYKLLTVKFRKQPKITIRKRKLLGGALLYVFGLLSPPKKTIRTSKETNKYCVSNFEKYLPKDAH